MTGVSQLREPARRLSHLPGLGRALGPMPREQAMEYALTTPEP